ncbi:MAG: hypothetical protein ACKV19_26240 [Verrucomicrobiales bacterium]
MKRPSKPASGQFTLALYPQPSPHLDATRKEEVLKVLSDLLLEAVGMEPAGSQVEKEENNES